MSKTDLLSPSFSDERKDMLKKDVNEVLEHANDEMFELADARLNKVYDELEASEKSPAEVFAEQGFTTTTVEVCVDANDEVE